MSIFRRRPAQGLRIGLRRIGRQPLGRWVGPPDSGLGGFDEPGFSVAILANGQVKVLLGSEDGAQVAFVMKASVARRFFERGVAIIEAHEMKQDSATTSADDG